MENLLATIETLKKVVNGSRPNIKYSQIMSCISTLESQVRMLSPQPQVETIIENPLITNKQMEEVINEDLLEVENIEIDLLKYENYSLSELRNEFPDIKATSKEVFLEKLYSL
jgi:hypothetical protein